MAPTDEALGRAQVKGESTKCWKKAGILNKYSEVLDTPEAFDRYDGKTYIWKPNCSSGSRNITILSGEELTEANARKAWKRAAEASADGKGIVEEFCEGTEYTVEMLGDGYGNVGVYGISKKYHTPYNTRNKIAVNLHYCPPDVSDPNSKQGWPRLGRAVTGRWGFPLLRPSGGDREAGWDHGAGGDGRPVQRVYRQPSGGSDPRKDGLSSRLCPRDPWGNRERRNHISDDNPHLCTTFTMCIRERDGTCGPSWIFCRRGLPAMPMTEPN